MKTLTRVIEQQLMPETANQQKKEDEDKKDDGTINNPFLRTVRMPRNAIVGATVPTRRIQTML